MKTDVSCNLCGQDNYEVVFPTDFGRIVRCKHCDLMYSNPRDFTDPLTIDSYYQDPRLRQQYLNKQYIQRNDYQRILPLLAGLRPAKGSLLEIGSYVGAFLTLARDDGWDVTGIEPTKWCVEYARTHMHLDLMKTILREARFPDQTFDAVVMLHVIEHLEDALAELMEISRILKPGGVLVVETPRYDTIWFKLLKDRERSVIRDHYYYFTPPTLKAMISRCGLTPVRTDIVGRTLTIDRLLFNIVKVMKSDTVFKLYNRLSPRLGLDKVTIHVNTRDMMRIYAVKRPDPQPPE